MSALCRAQEVTRKRPRWLAGLRGFEPHCVEIEPVSPMAGLEPANKRLRAQQPQRLRRPYGSPSIWSWRGHAIGASNRRATPIPCGSPPSTAAWTRLGARNASEIDILTWRLLQACREAIPSIVAAPASISDSHCRPRAIAVTSFARVSERIGRASAGTITSRCRR
jgi:hypothetical protein